MVAARAHRGQSADVLLRSVRTSDTPPRARGVLCALRAGELGVRGTVLFSAASRMGILCADHLSGVGLRRACALSTVPVVCRLEAASQRCLAQLFLNGDHTSSIGRRSSFRLTVEISGGWPTG